MPRYLAFLIVLCLSSSLLASDYVVVTSSQTYQDVKWKTVVDTLLKKHDATVVTFEETPKEALPTLRNHFPKFTCFVATPAEAGRKFVAAVHQLTRELDDDVYTDTRWGILTGYDAANALSIAQHEEPLTIRKVASGTDVELTSCVEGMWYDELQKNRHVRKLPGEQATELKGPDDTTAALVSTLNDYHADLFVASGHATERDWQIGFRYRNGYFRCRDGQLYGFDTQQKEHPVHSDNAKVYMPIGNCLMGHIDSPDAMAVAWMNSAGVKQMIGYTVPTWFGYGGWGMLDYFVEQPGRYTYQEAFLANHHALLHRLNDPGTPQRDLRGLAYDRDTVAFYGDPAWEAKMADGPLWYEQSLEESDGTYTFTITPLKGEESFDTVNSNGSQRGGRPFIAFLPKRVTNVQVEEGAQFAPVITDDFILFPRPKTCDPKKSYRIVFTANPIE